MPLPNSPGRWQQSAARRFLKWLGFSWRTARRILITIAVIITLIAVYYAEENLRGSRAWARYRQEAEARGVQLDWRALIPKPVPNEENFAATPLIKSWFVVRSNYMYVASEYWRTDNYGQAGGDYNGQIGQAIFSFRSRKDDGNRHITDLVAWKTAFDALHVARRSRHQIFESGKLDLASRAQAAPSVLEALKTNEVVFAELRAANQRPYSRYPVNYDVPDPAEILLPHLSSIRSICRRLGLKACAELALGQNKEAFQDVKLSFSVADSVKDEPFLISYLVRVACLQTTVQPIWEGLAEHAWSDAQLRELETKLQSYDFIADLKPTLDAERAWGVGLMNYVKSTGKLAEFNDSGTGNEPALEQLARTVPSGWFDLEQLSYCRLFDLYIASTFDATERRVDPSRGKSNGEAIMNKTLIRNPWKALDFALIHHRILAGQLLPGLARVSYRAATGQVAANQAVLACALERYRLANSRFPDTLDALVPQFISPLPHDVITGESYKYRRTDDGRFVLYSVGWNEKDDGGVPGKTLFDDKEGDWVWQYPASQ
jgi:hypothetical protein